MDRFSDSLEFQIAENCGTETENFSPWFGLEQMSLDEVRLLDPFRDDPVRENTNDVDVVSDSSFIESEEEDIREKKSLFECCCLGSCRDDSPGFMKEQEERKCCKGSSWSSLDLSGYDCITDHPILDKLLDKEILEVMLSVVVEVFRGDSEVTPRNLRFAAYRCIFHWLFKKKHPRKVENYREVIPTCIVKLEVGKRKKTGNTLQAKARRDVPASKRERVATETSTALSGSKVKLRVTGVSLSVTKEQSCGDIFSPEEVEIPSDSLSVGVSQSVGPDSSPIFKRKLPIKSTRDITVLSVADSFVHRRKTGDSSSDED